MSDNATKHALILAGIGWGSLQLWLIERDLAEHRLVRIAAARKLEHDPEKLAPGLIISATRYGWIPVFGKIMLQQ